MIPMVFQNVIPRAIIQSYLGVVLRVVVAQLVRAVEAVQLLLRQERNLQRRQRGGSVATAAATTAAAVAGRVVPEATSP